MSNLEKKIRGLTNIRRKSANSSTFRSVQMETKLAITIKFTTSPRLKSLNNLS